jgi:hypothetical protein
MNLIPRNWMEVVVALAMLALAGVVERGVPGSGEAIAPEAERVVGLAGPVIVVERSTAAGCQPWRWNRDHTACITATAKQAHAIAAAVGLTRGREYRYSQELWLEPGLVLGAVGDPDLPRPILRGSATARGVMLRDGGEIRNLDIRGPHYNASPFPVRFHDDWAFKGINAATQSHWSVIGTSVNGFKGTGLLAVMSDGIRILDSTFAHNGYSGVSLFPHEGYCGTGVLFRGNVLELNGQDGIDACSSEARYERNVFRNNGWFGHGGDQNGLLVFTFAVTSTHDIQIRDNVVYGNNESGIRVAGRRVTGVVIEGNRVERNGHYGLHVGGEGGDVREVRVRANQVTGNIRGCLSPDSERVASRGSAGCVGGR